MRIRDHDTDRDVLIVAEVGNNHEGSFTLAEELIGLAAGAGAGAVKFQTFRTEAYVSPRDRARFQRLRSFELTLSQFERLAATAERAGVLFLSTPFDLHSAAGLRDLVAAYKIASGDNTFYPLLESVASTGRPVILSTGLAGLEEIDRARRTIEHAWCRAGVRGELGLLHCVSSYPVPPEQANLAAIGTLRAAFGGTIGYSDHTMGIDAATCAVAAGARILEKHFTIDHNHSDFRDHQLSADPCELAELVRRVRTIEAMLGRGDPAPRACERDAVEPMRRTIAAARDLPRGAVLEPADLTWVRPGGRGLPPGREPELVGRVLAAPIAAGEAITLEALALETAAL